MSGPLWTAAEAVAATGGGALGEWTARGVAIDSRAVGPGDLFVALAGERFDGHDFVADALARGAAAAMVARREALPHGAAGLLVGDTQAGLEALGRAARVRTAARVVGVTGSVGKTGTKEMLGRALGALGPTAYSARSFNNHIGVPLTLARIPADAAYAVCEMGMNHAGEIAALTRQVRPHAAIVTTIEPAHLQFFPSVEAIADAKAEIFRSMPGGIAVLNRDNDHFDRLAAAARACGVERVIGFGADLRAEVRLIQYRPECGRSGVTASVAGRTVGYTLGIEGRHWAQNSLAVLAVVHAFAGDIDAATATFAGMSAPKGRGARHRIDWRGGTILVIDDSYNASPASMRAAFAVLGSTCPDGKGRRLAALGDMRELGAASATLHAGLAGTIAAAGVDLVFTVGDEMRHLQAALPCRCRGGHADGAASLLPMLTERLRPGDTLLVKGSAATGMGRIVDALLAAGRGEACRDAV